MVAHRRIGTRNWIGTKNWIGTGNKFGTRNWIDSWYSNQSCNWCNHCPTPPKESNATIYSDWKTEEIARLLVCRETHPPYERANRLEPIVSGDSDMPCR